MLKFRLSPVAIVEFRLKCGWSSDCFFLLFFLFCNASSMVFSIFGSFRSEVSTLDFNVWFSLFTE